MLEMTKDINIITNCEVKSIDKKTNKYTILGDGQKDRHASDRHQILK